MIPRPDYLNFLKDWKDKQIIKVVSGVRRCGKSTLFEIYQDYLRSIGVSDDQIIAINFEEAENESLLEYHALYDYVKSLMQPGKMNNIVQDDSVIYPVKVRVNVAPVLQFQSIWE